MESEWTSPRLNSNPILQGMRYMLIQLLTESWLFFKNHIVALSIIILPIVVPIDIFIAMYEYSFSGEEYVFSEHVIPMTIGFIAYPIYAVAVVFYISSIISGEHLDTKLLWKLGLKFWLPYMILSLLVTLALMAGFILLVIPGIILFIRYSFAEFELLFNQSNPIDAMANSWNATREYMWVLFGGILIISIAFYLPYYLIFSLFDESSLFYLVLEVVLNIIYSVLAVLYTIFAFRVYEFAKSQADPSLDFD